MATKLFTSLENETAGIKQKATPLSLMLEDFDERGVMNDTDVDYLEHLDVPMPNEETAAAALEGIGKAILHNIGHGSQSAYSEAKGWFLGIEAKRQYIQEICASVIEWLKEKDQKHPNLDLEMGAFKTWMKTSEFIAWRYYFLLNDKVWSDIEQDLKNQNYNGDVSALEKIYNINFKDRKEVAKLLDSVKNIKGLIELFETYAERSDKFFKLIAKRPIKIKGAPFQVILLGANDLRRTVKKIVNLAL